MTDYDGIQGSQHPKLANPAQYDHEKWVQKRRVEIRKQARREVVIMSAIFAVLLVLLLVVLFYATAIDNYGGAV